MKEALIRPKYSFVLLISLETATLHLHNYVINAYKITGTVKGFRCISKI